jgi:hypothetical protein
MDQKDLLRKEIRQLEIALSRSTSLSPNGHSANNADANNVKPKSPLSSGSRALAQKAWRERHEAERAARALAISELEQRAVMKVKLKNAHAMTKLRSQQAHRRKIEHHAPSTLADSIELSSPLSITAVEELSAGTLEAAVKDLNKAIEESRGANQSETLSLELKSMDESNAVAENSLSVDNEKSDRMHNINGADPLTSHSRWEKIKTNLSNVVLSTKGGFDLEAITTESSHSDKNELVSVSSLSSMKLSINLENDDEEPFQFVPTPTPSPPPPPPPPRLSSKKARSLWAVIKRNIGNISVASKGGFDALQSGLVASQSSIDLLEKINSSSPAVLNDEEGDSASTDSAGTDEILAMLP